MDVLNAMWPEEELWKSSDSSILEMVANELSPQQVVPTSSPDHCPESSFFSPQLMNEELLQPLFFEHSLVEPTSSPISSASESLHSTPSPPLTRSRRSAAPSVSTKPTKKIAKTPSSDKPKRKRKRAKHTPTAVIISNVQLKTMTCEQIDALAADIERERPLTAEEDADFKSYKRRIMNRESARESRQKKQELIKDISDALTESKEHSARLERRIRALEAENAKLRLAQGLQPTLPTVTSEVMDIEDSDCTSPDSCSSSSPASPNSFWSLGKASLPGKAGVCLFVVLLSFGLMFTAIQPGDFNNHSQLSAIAPVLLRHSSGRTITNEPFISSAQVEKLSSIASASGGGMQLEQGVHFSRDLLQFEPSMEKKSSWPSTSHDDLDGRQLTNTTTFGCEEHEGYNMDLSIDASGVSVMFSTAQSGSPRLEVDVRYADVPVHAPILKDHTGIANNAYSASATEGHPVLY